MNKDHAKWELTIIAFMLLLVLLELHTIAELLEKILEAFNVK